ncbi:E3 ubiquitin-protein ligase RNF115 isoform X3 [Neopsephotus bourkii]|uniref:E3 ubiquitin-protein ligase RNF115 isoform X3 n=1 Tax=Neopsephotus bourkii TaxID=309878 RepID=UPI002AA52B7D|nr:E3 ubiquitin-protein ligase RNF115 isoform X3 [Neopsephotus bourkii]
MAEASAAAVPQHRFFCHSCKGEVSPKLPEYTCPRCESGFIEEVTEDSSFLDGSGIDDSPATQFAELWDHLDHTMFFPDFRPFLSSSSLEQDNRDTERGHQAHADLWGPSRPPRLPMTRRYRARGSSRPDRSPAIEGIIQQIFAGFFANSALPGSQHPFSWSGMLHSNPGDYAWGQSGLDAIVTQLLGQLENTGPPPADKEKISSLPTVTVTQEQVGSGMLLVPVWLCRSPVVSQSSSCLLQIQAWSARCAKRTTRWPSRSGSCPATTSSTATASCPG